MSKKDSYINDWSNTIKNTKTRVTRIYAKYDSKRKTPFIFDGWRRDYKTGEKLISMHTKRQYDDELDAYLSYVLDFETFSENFEEVEVEM